MQESIVHINDEMMESSVQQAGYYTVGSVAPFFSMRKVRLIYNELTGSKEFEFASFDAFKHQVLSSVAPQIELNKWQAIAARR